MAKKAGGKSLAYVCLLSHFNIVILLYTGYGPVAGLKRDGVRNLDQ